MGREVLRASGGLAGWLHTGRQVQESPCGTDDRQGDVAFGTAGLVGLTSEAHCDVAYYGAAVASWRMWLFFLNAPRSDTDNTGERGNTLEH
jgi:hypothetical protein